MSELGDNVASLVSSPVDLAESITSLFESVNGLYATAGATFDVIRGFFDFGDADAETPILQNTAGRIERAKNQNLLNSIIQSQSLVLNYGNAAETEFSTVSELEQAASLLEEQYQKVVAVSELEDDTKKEIETLRVLTQSFFEEQKITTAQIITINTVQIPAKVLSYQYYASSDAGPDIAKLNKENNVSFLNGETQIFTA